MEIMIDSDLRHMLVTVEQLDTVSISGVLDVLEECLDYSIDIKVDNSYTLREDIKTSNTKNIYGD